jgi:hypothetical protein
VLFERQELLAAAAAADIVVVGVHGDGG